MNFSNRDYKRAVKKAAGMSKAQLEKIAVNGKKIKDMTPEELDIVVRKAKMKGDFSKIRKEVDRETIKNAPLSE